MVMESTEKKIFTTGEAAEICRVSQQTIIRQFDAGRIEGYKVPGSKFRRIPRESLVRFMIENKIPIDESRFPEQVVPRKTFSFEGMRIFVIDWKTGGLVLEIAESLKQYCQLKRANSPLSASTEASQFKPHVILLSFSTADTSLGISSFCEWVHSNSILKRTRIIAVIEGSLPDDLSIDKFDVCVFLTPEKPTENAVKVMKAIMGSPEPKKKESSSVPG